MGVGGKNRNPVSGRVTASAADAIITKPFDFRDIEPESHVRPCLAQCRLRKASWRIADRILMSAMPILVEDHPEDRNPVYASRYSDLNGPEFGERCGPAARARRVDRSYMCGRPRWVVCRLPSLVGHSSLASPACRPPARCRGAIASVAPR